MTCPDVRPNDRVGRVQNPVAADRAVVPVFIAARSSSRRLPGKTLMTVHGTPLISYVVDAVNRSRGVPVVVTSSDTTDEPIASWCSLNGVAVRRGSLHDVAHRMLDAAASLGVSAFVRISGDSPLIDPGLIDVALDLYDRHAPNVDLVTNVFPRTFPKGQSVEVIRTEALRAALGHPEVTEEMREHVTAAIYARPSLFRVVNFEVDDVVPAAMRIREDRYRRRNHADVQLSVDDIDDLERFACIVARLGFDVADADWLTCVDAAVACDAADGSG